jgi:hypothetical protein
VDNVGKELAAMSEHEEQCALFHWIQMNTSRFPELGLAFAVPNGTRTTPQIARKMKAEGVQKGVPDICFPIPRQPYHGMFVEMKTETGRTSPEQKAWLKALAERGYYTAVCRSWTEAKELIESYLNGEI